MIRPDLLTYISSVTSDLTGLQEVAVDLRDSEPHVKEWLDKSLKQLLNNLCVKFKIQDKNLRNGIHEELFRSFFMGFLATRNEAESTLKRSLDIEYDRQAPGCPTKRAYHMWIDGHLSEEYYQINPDDFPAEHPYRQAFANYQKQKAITITNEKMGMDTFQDAMAYAAANPSGEKANEIPQAPDSLSNAAGGDDLQT